MIIGSRSQAAPRAVPIGKNSTRKSGATLGSLPSVSARLAQGVQDLVAIGVSEVERRSLCGAQLHTIRIL